jgi:hypothetical protein
LSIHHWPAHIAVHDLSIDASRGQLLCDLLHKHNGTVPATAATDIHAHQDTVYIMLQHKRLYQPGHVGDETGRA